MPLIFYFDFAIPLWNKQVENYVFSQFYFFVDKFFHHKGSILLFHVNDLHVLKEIQSYFKEYHFQIKSKWHVINQLPLFKNEDEGKRVNPFPFVYSPSLQIPFFACKDSF
jgi:hypothetical protein